MSDQAPDLRTHSGRLRWARETYVKPDGDHFRSDREAAKFFGWPLESYRKHESGERQAEGFKIETAKRYAKGFGVNINWLLAGTGSPYNRPEPEAPAATLAPLRNRK